MRKRNENAPRTSKKEKSKIKTEKQNTEQEKNNLIISENREGKACAYTNTQCIQYKIYPRSYKRIETHITVYRT